ncbi:MAG TPA: patatin-like phospholipase family protein [Anaerolineales bacterium]|nr:patatin-like phospholipase family protein [Anaerolineales bacterium]
MEYDLVFEGGGAKGILFVGALQEFEARGHTVGRLMGTSAGAITATLLAAGYTPGQMKAVVVDRLPNGAPRFSSFMDVPAKFDEVLIKKSLLMMLFQSIDLPLIPDALEEKVDKRIMDTLMQASAFRQLFSFTEVGGLYSGELFRLWFREKLNAGGRLLGTATFEEFHQKTGKDLSLVASDVTGQQMLILNHLTAPKLPVYTGVRMSMSIPFVWKEVVWEEGWGRYRNQNITGHAIVDGGALSNFPISYLIDDTDEIRAVMGNQKGSGNVLGLLIDDEIDVPGLPPKTQPVSAEGKKKIDIDLESRWFVVLQRVGNLINTMMNARDKAAIKTHRKNVCHLPAKGVGTVEFDMSEERIECLIATGNNAMKKYLEHKERRERARTARGR